MAANKLLNRIWKCAAIFVAVAIAATSAGTPGRVAMFFFTTPTTVASSTDAVVDLGTSVTVRCRVEYNSTRPPTVNLKKTFGNGTWHVATNDVIDDAFVSLNRFSANIIDNQPNGNDTYEWTITNVQSGDTGNYTCFVQSTSNVSSLSVSLNVSVEPTQLSLYVDSELQPQSMSPTKKTFNVGQMYRLTCVTAGSNPFPNITLTRGTNALPISYANQTTVRANYVDPVSAVTRTSTIGTTWTMTNSDVGSVITCKAGVKNPNAMSNSFMAIADNALPNFNCPDQFDYDGKQTTLTLSCQVASTSALLSYYISWQNSTANITLSGIKDVDVRAPTDSRYSLRVTGPQNNDIWWTMKLTISNANMIGDLGKTTFHYVAIGNRGQAVHDVSVRSSGGPISDGSLTVSPIGCLALLISIAMATLFSRQ